MYRPVGLSCQKCIASNFTDLSVFLLISIGNTCWFPPNSDQPGRNARGHYVVQTLMPDNARAYDLLSVGTLLVKII